LLPGTYTVTVADSNGKSIVATTDLDGLIPPTAYFNLDQPFIGSSNGAIQVIPDGNASDYTYLWSTGDSTSSISGLVSGTYTVFIGKPQGCLQEFSVFLPNQPLTELGIWGLLQGPFELANGLMNTDLYATSYLPATSPYPDGKTLTKPPTAPEYSAIVDWVQIAFLNKSDRSPIFTTSGLLKNDGQLMDINGTSPLRIPLAVDSFYVKLIHRNHINIETANLFKLNDLIDLRTVSLYGNQTAAIEGSFQLMYAGDIDQNQQINASDRSLVWNARNQIGYFNTDINLDGACNAADRSKVWNNRNKSGL